MSTSENTVATQQEIIVTGFGGQGIILAGRIIGMAASLGDDKESTLTQAYGPESRGGACNAQVIISDRPIHYPYVKTPHILVAMSQAGYNKFAELADRRCDPADRPGPGTQDRRPLPHYEISATRMAEGLGNKMMANIIMIGFFTAITGAVSKKAAQDTILQSVPRGTEEKNTKAFNKGYDYGVSTLKGKEKRAAGKTGAIA
jgi:2-oxoglutarate ferredoxin oxidoreductase subunit gamma